MVVCSSTLGKKKEGRSAPASEMKDRNGGKASENTWENQDASSTKKPGRNEPIGKPTRWSVQRSSRKGMRGKDIDR